VVYRTVTVDHIKELGMPLTIKCVVSLHSTMISMSDFVIIFVRVIFTVDESLAVEGDKMSNQGQFQDRVDSSQGRYIK